MVVLDQVQDAPRDRETIAQKTLEVLAIIAINDKDELEEKKADAQTRHEL